MHLPVDDAKRQLQVPHDLSSAAPPHLLCQASAAQNMAGMRGPALHGLVRLLRPEDRLSISEGNAHPFANRVRFFAGESGTPTRKASMRWSIGGPSVPSPSDLNNRTSGPARTSISAERLAARR
jgi:hypothetical protein